MGWRHDPGRYGHAGRKTLLHLCLMCSSYPTSIRIFPRTVTIVSSVSVSAFPTLYFGSLYTHKLFRCFFILAGIKQVTVSTCEYSLLLFRFYRCALLARASPWGCAKRPGTTGARLPASLTTTSGKISATKRRWATLCETRRHHAKPTGGMTAYPRDPSTMDRYHQQNK